MGLESAKQLKSDEEVQHGLLEAGAAISIAKNSSISALNNETGVWIRGSDGKAEGSGGGVCEGGIA